MLNQDDHPALFDAPKVEELPTEPVVLNVKVEVNLSAFIKQHREMIGEYLASDDGLTLDAAILEYLRDAMDLADGLMSLKWALQIPLGEDFASMVTAAEEAARPHYPLCRIGDGASGGSEPLDAEGLLLQSV